jgi:hypothetical protein
VRRIPLETSRIFPAHHAQSRPGPTPRLVDALNKHLCEKFFKKKYTPCVI